MFWKNFGYLGMDFGKLQRRSRCQENLVLSQGNALLSDKKFKKILTVYITRDEKKGCDETPSGLQNPLLCCIMYVFNVIILLQKRYVLCPR